MPASTTRLPKTAQQTNHRALILSMLVWFTHLNLLYTLNNVSCKWAFLNFSLGGIAALQWLEVLISLIALAVIAYMTVLAWRNWRRLQSQPPADNPHMLRQTEEDRGAFLGFLALGINIFFLLFVIGTFVPMLTLKACGQA